jgi:hypothetical protein
MISNDALNRNRSRAPPRLEEAADEAGTTFGESFNAVIEMVLTHPFPTPKS